ncbi:MAG: aspartate aminotransferase family protein [Acidimicrobiia bacterium]|nr:aspartate aminotransferase family protein [Acidimicrobiia bacterium]MCY4432356.1 aspartate aminotransferase family protein [bacterium]
MGTGKVSATTGALWMPFTSAGGSRPPVVVAGEGNYVVTDDGTQLLDATAGGVACVILGHGRTEIADAVAEQLRTLEYHCLFGYSHPRAQELAAEVAARTPGDLNHVFFTNSGSEAVETALKMARGYWRRVGQASKTGFVSLHRGYHGMNFGGISVGGLTENRAGFGPLLEGCTQVPAHDIDALEAELVYRDPSTVAAVVMEPVQAAGGVYPPPEDYLCQVRAMCDHHDVLLLLDEVVCGFGRLGHWFGGHRYGVVPDIMTVAKGLTSAYIPMGAAIASSRVHEAFVDPEGSIELMHGYTYSGHPAACVAGLKVIEIIEREGLVEHSRQTGIHLQKQVSTLASLPLVGEVRGEGMLAAVELVGDSPEPLVAEAQRRIQSAGVLVRAQADHLGIYPPFTFTDTEVVRVVDTTRTVLEELV